MKNLFDKDLATIVAKDGQHTLIAPNGKEIPSCSTVVTDIAGDIPMVKVEMPVNICGSIEEARDMYDVDEIVTKFGNIPGKRVTIKAENTFKDCKYDDLPPHISRSMVDPDHPDYISGRDLVEAIKRAEQRNTD